MGYDLKYYERHATQYREWERAIGRDVVSRFRVKSAVDFGCGVGSYLEGIAEAGVANIRGFELSYEASIPHTPETVRHCIERRDVTQQLSIGRYDLALSIEVAEHLPPAGTEQFLTNLTEAADRLIVFSAAPPGQRGTHHINCRPKEFWLSAIQERGFEFLTNETAMCVRAWKEFKTAKWVLRNVSIFRRRNAIQPQSM